MLSFYNQNAILSNDRVQTASRFCKSGVEIFSRNTTIIQIKHLYVLCKYNNRRLLHLNLNMPSNILHFWSLSKILRLPIPETLFSHLVLGCVFDRVRVQRGPLRSRHCSRHSPRHRRRLFESRDERLQPGKILFVRLC